MPVEISVTEEKNRVPFICHIPDNKNFTLLVGDIYQLCLQIKKSTGDDTVYYVIGSIKISIALRLRASPPASTVGPPRAAHSVPFAD
jgi:hypothetical protein